MPKIVCTHRLDELDDIFDMVVTPNFCKSGAKNFVFRN